MVSRERFTALMYEVTRLDESDEGFQRLLAMQECIVSAMLIFLKDLKVSERNITIFEMCYGVNSDFSVTEIARKFDLKPSQVENIIKKNTKRVKYWHEHYNLLKLTEASDCSLLNDVEDALDGLIEALRPLRLYTAVHDNEKDGSSINMDEDERQLFFDFLCWNVGFRGLRDSNPDAARALLRAYAGHGVGGNLGSCS